MKIDGACHCGAISYEAEINPEYVVICHCTDCQTMSGAPYRASVPARAEKFTLHGEPKTYVKTAASGNKRMLAFCADCGTALYSTTLDGQRVFNLRLGAIKQRTQLPPEIARLVQLRDAMGHGYQSDSASRMNGRCWATTRR